MDIQKKTRNKTCSEMNQDMFLIKIKRIISNAMKFVLTYLYEDICTTNKSNCHQKIELQNKQVNNSILRILYKSVERLPIR